MRIAQAVASPAASRDFTVPTGIATRGDLAARQALEVGELEHAALVVAELGERGAHARVIGAGCRADSSANDLEPGVAGIARHARGLLEVEGSRAHTDGQPGTNPAALRIEILCGSPRLEEHVV